MLQPIIIIRNGERKGDDRREGQKRKEKDRQTKKKSLDYKIKMKNYGEMRVKIHI